MSSLIDGARRRLAPALALLAAGLLAACGGGTATAKASAACVKADAGSVVQLTAENIAFSAACIEVTAGKPLTIEFNNTDSVPHDFAVYQDSTKAIGVFRGEVAQSGQSKTYHVPAVAAGDHVFVCTIHGNMTGTLRVVAAATSSPG